MKKISISEAIKSLCPEAQFIIVDSEYSSIQWLSEDIEKPSEEDILFEMSRLEDNLNVEQDYTLQQEVEREANKQSALEKLAKLGLTEEEAKAVIGID
jgi:uncharacterized UBP type Zn finger protein